jgi:SAM-dependent methyltransferase
MTPSSSREPRPYGGQAAVYDAEYAGVEHDARFFVERLRAWRVRTPVLELGCGTGRVAVPLAMAGFACVGLDTSDRMLRIARRNSRQLAPEVAARLRYTKRDATAFRFARPFGAILSTFSLHALLLEPPARAACLARCREHLAPDGVLLLDVFVPRTGPGATRERPHAFERTFPLGRGGRSVRKRTEEWRDEGAAVDHVRYAYRTLRSDGSEAGAFDVVFRIARLQPDTVEAELEAAGFVVVERSGDYRGAPFGPDSERLIVEAIPI